MIEWRKSSILPGDPLYYREMDNTGKLVIT